MMYVSMPRKARVESIELMPEYNEVTALLLKHGYYISFFGHKNVSFYKIIDRDEDWRVPINSRYHMERKDFLLFLEVIRKLDAAEARARRHLEQMAHMASNWHNRPAY